MVTTDEDNVVKGTVTESDRLGNITTYVEVGMERLDDTMTGRDARRRSPLYPLALVVVALAALVLGLPGTTLLGAVALMFLAVWVVGATR